MKRRVIVGRIAPAGTVLSLDVDPRLLGQVARELTVGEIAQAVTAALQATLDYARWVREVSAQAS